jgi:hypothetical protein
MRGRSALLLLLLLAHTSAGCSRREPGLFSEQNARAHVGMLAGTIGSRPIGSAANARARAYIVDQLRLFGFDVRVQETEARRVSIGRAARVANIIAVKPGRRSEAIGLLSHYDSVPAGPGAADDAFGVGVSLEAARVLAARTDRNWTLMVLVTDGEEADLMGAAALMTDRDVTDRLRTYINLESTGSGEPAMLFEAGPGNGWLVAPWARSAPYPRGGSFATEIYRRLPNDTDFSILKLHDFPGLNIAAVGDSYAYHTARDTPDRLSTQMLRRTGEQTVALVTALDSVDITQRSTNPHQFVDLAGTTALAYGNRTAMVIAAVALILGVIAWVRVTATTIEMLGVPRWLLACVWTLLGSAAVVAAMIGTTWALRAAREVYHPWYAKPDRLFFLLLAVGISAGWAFARLGRWLPRRAHGPRHPAVVWTVALPVWILLALAAFWYAPGAAAFWMLPLLTAGLLLAILPSSNALAVRAASIVILAIAGMIWIHNTIDLLHYLVALFGRLPLVTPSFVYAGLMAVAGMMLVPPFIAITAREQPLLRPSLTSAICLLMIAVAAAMAYVAPAYTFEQPLRRHVRVVHEGDRPALWQVGSLEPGLDLGPGAPDGWKTGIPAADVTTFRMPLRDLPHPFAFHLRGPTVGPPPIGISDVTLEPVAAGSELTIAITPKETGVMVWFVMPEGLQPARASLPGSMRDRSGRWTAVYMAPPIDGLMFRASFSAADAARIKEMRVLATVQGFGGQGWQAPAWLPQERTVWSGDATWVIDPFSLPIAPVPPLR